MTRTKISLAPLLALLACACLAVAHDFWLEPSSHRVSPGDRVDVAIMIGHHDDLNTFARRADHAKSFKLVGPEQSWDVAGQAGDDPAGHVTAPEAGAYWLVYHGNPSFIELEARKFEDYLRHEGLEPIIEQRATLGETDKAGLEAYARCAKAVLRVGDASTGNGSTEAHAAFLRKPVGLPLELVVLEDPFSLRPGDDIRVRLLYNGEPLAGAMVEAMHRQSEHATPKAISVRTDDRGEATVKLDRAGRWVLANTHMVRKASATDEIAPADEKRADWESFWATLSLEIAP